MTPYRSPYAPPEEARQLEERRIREAVDAWSRNDEREREERRRGFVRLLAWSFVIVAAGLWAWLLIRG